MRVMVIVKASKDSEAGIMPSERLLTEMGQYNEGLVNAGIMLAGGRTAPEFERRPGPILREEAHGS